MKKSFENSFLEVDIAFSGFIPEKLKENLDNETKDFLTNHEIWNLIIKSWIQYIRHDSNLTCPSLVRTNKRVLHHIIAF